MPDYHHLEAFPVTGFWPFPGFCPAGFCGRAGFWPAGFCPDPN